MLFDKGQTTWKGFFVVLEFSHKTNERIRGSSLKQIGLFVFLGEFEDTKSPFKII